MDSEAQEASTAGARSVNVELRLLPPNPESRERDEREFLCECGKCRDRVRLLPDDFDLRIVRGELVLAPGHVYAAAAEARRVARKLRRESRAVRAQADQAVRHAQQRVARVLVVDDNAKFLGVARSVVSAATNLRVIGSAVSGEQAVRCLPELRPDLILLDVLMPGMNGVETARMIRREFPNVLIVLMSATPEVLMDDARSAGAIALLDKADLSSRTLDALWLEHRPGPTV